jgi:hypothetical protein
MLCLLQRELCFDNVCQLWDCYFAEGTHSFGDFHVYVCAAFLHGWSSKLRNMEFSDLIMFLQHLPTTEWTSSHIHCLIESAYSIAFAEQSYVAFCAFVVVFTLVLILLIYLLLVLLIGALVAAANNAVSHSVVL